MKKENEKKENVALIDGSAFVFIHGNKENYKDTIKEHLEHILEENNATKYVMFLENSKSNFRHNVAVTDSYKGHRELNRAKVDTYLPFLNNVIKEVKTNYQPVTCQYVENDDALSICSRLLQEGDTYNPIVCGDDSDLMCIPGQHWKLKKNLRIDVTHEGSIELVDKSGKKSLFSTGLYSTYAKILCGAAKENYKGLPKYGAVKVYELLKNTTTEADMRKLCFDLFINEFGYEEGIKRLQEGFRLCFLLRENKNFVIPEFRVYNKPVREISKPKTFSINAIRR